MKGQTQAVTAVLISTVVVGAVATAYMWGTPLLQKSQAEADLSQVQSETVNLHNKIQEVGESGSGSADTISLNLETDSEEGRIDINEDENYIDITTSSENVPYPMDTWTPIHGRNMQNLSILSEELEGSSGAGDYATKGDDTPGVTAVRPVGGAGSSIVVFRIEFRNMLTETPEGSRLEKIDLRAQDGVTSSGDSELVITNEGSEVDSGEDEVELSTGTTIERERTVLRLNLR